MVFLKYKIYYDWLESEIFCLFKPLWKSHRIIDLWHDKFKLKQEARGPRLAHLSGIATADMQLLCNIFSILSSQLMKKSSFEQF